MNNDTTSVRSNSANESLKPITFHRKFATTVFAIALVLSMITMSNQDGFGTELLRGTLQNYFCLKTANHSDQSDVYKHRRNPLFCFPNVSRIHEFASNGTGPASQEKKNNTKAVFPAVKTHPAATKTQLHCSGLKFFLSRSGTVTTGTGPAPSPNDCRWVITAPNASHITLTFADFNVPGVFGRVWIFVGPADVALWSSNDVIETGRAYASFTGSMDPSPVECDSNTVLVVFETEDSDADHAGFNMTWTSTGLAHPYP